MTVAADRSGIEPVHSRQSILAVIERHGLVPAGAEPSIEVVTARGGRTTYLVTLGDMAILIKTTAPHWWAIEAGIQRAASIRCPGAVPDVLAELPEINGYAMAFVRPDWAIAWRLDERRGGNAREAVAGHVGDHLGRFHRATHGCAAIERAAEGNRAYVAALRETLFWHCALHDPVLEPVVRRTLCESFERRDALAQGDVSLNNVLVAPQGIVMLDFEKAWFGDPAFDCGYMLSALIRRAMRIRRRPVAPPLAGEIRCAGRQWLRHVTWESPDAAADRAVRVALIRTIARHHHLMLRQPAPPPPSVERDIGILVRLLRAEVGGIDQLAAALETDGFAAATSGCGAGDRD